MTPATEILLPPSKLPEARREANRFRAAKYRAGSSRHSENKQEAARRCIGFVLLLGCAKARVERCVRPPASFSGAGLFSLQEKGRPQSSYRRDNRRAQTI